MADPTPDVDLGIWDDFVDKTNLRWDDLRFPAQAINPPGGVNDPDLESNTGLLLFDDNTPEVIAGVGQMPHTWVEGTPIIPHVHWQKTTSAAGDVLWQFEYEVVNNGDVAAMDYGTLLTASDAVAGTVDDDTANRILLTSFGEVAMTDKRISCLVFWKLTRAAGDGSDTYGADARLIELDFHYVVGGLGSMEEFTKTNWEW